MGVLESQSYLFGIHSIQQEERLFLFVSVYAFLVTSCKDGFASRKGCYAVSTPCHEQGKRNILISHHFFLFYAFYTGFYAPEIVNFKT